MSDYNTALRNGSVKFGYDFNSVSEVTHLHGSTAKKLPYRIDFHVPGKDGSMVLLISEDGGSGWHNIPHRGSNLDARGWRQIERIDEFNDDAEVSADRCREELANQPERIVYWHEEREGVRWYKFHGVFKVDETETRRSLEAGENKCIYRKVADSSECTKADWHLAEVTDAEFAELKGGEIEAVLKSETDAGVVWPGDRLRVVDVTASSLRAVLENQGEGAEIVIPRRDFELGYFRAARSGAEEVK